MRLFVVWLFRWTVQKQVLFVWVLKPDIIVIPFEWINVFVQYLTKSERQTYDVCIEGLGGDGV